MDNNLLLIVPIAFPALMGIIAFAMRERFAAQPFQGRYVITVLAANLALLLIALAGGGELMIAQLTEKLGIVLKVDEVSILFTVIASVMWLLAGIYSIDYMQHEHRPERFHMFYMISLGAVIGVGLSGNYLTLYLFFELMTLLTMPLVLHLGTRASLAAAIKYLVYSTSGAALGLVGFFFMYMYGDYTFRAGGTLDAASIAGREEVLLVVFFLAVVGFGAKAGMFPMHGWLPTAHPVAPTPASAVLSGVITKAGVLAIIRVVYYQAGVSFLRGTWVQYAWMILAMITIFMGSMLAYREKVMKVRLAYSSVSQVSYVLFGLATMHPLGMCGALLHMIFHSTAKDGLFMCAGAIIEKAHITMVEDLGGIGKRMPIVLWCFTIFGLSLVGIPPMCGAFSKWYLAVGSLADGVGTLSFIGPVVLLVSALLTAGYLLTITIRAFFPGKDFDYSALESCEPGKMMTVPLIILAAGTVLMGLFSSPLIDFCMSIATKVM